jgi:hypothetical protein
MSFQLKHWYIGDLSGDIAESVVVVPIEQQNGAQRAVFYELDRRKPKLGSTRGLNLLRLRAFDPAEIRSRLGERELAKCVARIEAKLAESGRA